MAENIRRPGKALVGALAVAASLATTLGVAAQAHAAEGQVRPATTQAVQDSYVVVFKDGAVTASAADHAARFGGHVTHTYTATIHGYAARLTAAQARRVAADPAVAYVQQDQVFTIAGTQKNPPNWGLDRIDQRALPLDNGYTYPDHGGKGVTAYVVDTGVRVSHKDFGGRARNGYDAVDNDNVAQDGHGHGTHVAGILGGSTYGVAKNVDIVAVRVLDDQGSGTLAQVVGGIDWVAKDAAGKKAVANLSLGGGGNTTIDDATRKAIKSGVTFVVAAGNSNRDAKGYSPARVSEAITVGASDNSDKRASFSNYGSLVDVFGPGVGILSAFNTDDTATHTYNGTSQATPHVAGVAALLIASGTPSVPATVEKAVKDTATKGKITDPKGAQNNLVYIGK